MTQIEEIRKQIQARILRLDLDHVHVRSQTSDWLVFNYPSWISVENGRLVFHFRPINRNAITQEVSQIFNLHHSTEVVTIGPRDWLEASARTATGLHVLIRYLLPVPHETRSPNLVLSFALHFQKIEFPVSTMQQLSLAEVDQYLAGNWEHEAEEPHSPSSTSVAMDRFYALIPGVELLIQPHATSTALQHPYHGELPSSARCCFVDEVCGGEFCLEKKDGNLEVHYRREVGEGSIADARRVFDGILDAVGFMHGCHPWPGHFSHGRDGRIVECWIKPVHKLQKDPLLPMTKSRMFISEEARNLFTMAAAFFASEGETIRYYKRSLWLMRSACEKNMPFPVRLITLCSILEGVLKRFSPRNNGEIDPANLRVGDANSWRSLVGHAGLSWGDFDNVYESHRAIRNQLAHGFDPSAEQPVDGEEFNAYSRISAAIYILMAKRMGFTGLIERSQLEGNAVVDLEANRS